MTIGNRIRDALGLWKWYVVYDIDGSVLGRIKGPDMKFVRMAAFIRYMLFSRIELE